MPDRTPYIPRTITVHMGLPNAWAKNITVTFPDYIKNVASSEIYPTWDDAALRANILAITSFALNRVYTEFYPSQGYDFNITSTTQHDQKFIDGRNIFGNISLMVDELFSDYIRREGFIEPLSTKFCNGTTTTCDGLSQWGSQSLAEAGENSMNILRHYYGDDIQLVVDAPVGAIQSSYPGYAIRLGDVGKEVVVIQTSLNRIAQDYPAIPKITVPNGVFNKETEDAIKKFQSIFRLTPDGIVGKATWYKLVYLFVGISDLSELVSEGQTMPRVLFLFPGVLMEGDSSEGVQVLQYMLAVVEQFYPEIPPVAVDGDFGALTTAAVIAFQRKMELVPDGIVGNKTWNKLYETFAGIDRTLRNDNVHFPMSNGNSIATMGRQNYAATTRLAQYSGSPLYFGSTDRKDIRLL